MPPKNHPARNVIYIHTHDMGRYISPYGYPVPTPNLQKFTKDSTLFRQAFSGAPTCSPSRACLLTGVTAHESGMWGLAHKGFKLSNPENHLAAFLRRNGFETVLCGIQHEFSDHSEDKPYDHIYKEQPSSDEEKADAAIEYLKQEHTKPFFLSLGFFYPHRKYKQADYNVYNPDHIRPPDGIPDTDETRKDMADYHCSVEDADANIGRVLQCIQETGRDQDSIIIITTDHGLAFPSMKCNLNDQGMGVTLMMDYPGNPAKGTATDSLVSHLDIYPTLCDLLELEPPDYLEGTSIRPLFEGNADHIREEVFAEVNFHGAYEPMRCVRTNRYKLIKRYYSGPRRLSNCDGSHTRNVMLEKGWQHDELPAVELFDLFFDPLEFRNLAGSPTYADILKDLEQKLTNWMKETNDPLLQGDITPLPGALVNVPESISAGDGPFIQY
ncbi:sulfatase family protein [Coraliomargarita parva]|uniref:sulfatase family protein n=1 Tax=Coraliomargarita parva TaxID=3014050 RepID=UPI0022B37FFF|nr:sulfatase [Coraliomargarita parva]